MVAAPAPARLQCAMRQALLIHPDSRRGGLVRVEAEALRAAPGELRLHFTLTGDMAALRLPPPAAPERADELWRTTCFEAFIRAPAGPAYVELNFSPATQWAAYAFSDTRAGMRSLELPAPPRIERRAGADFLELTAALDFGPSGPLPMDAPWRLGLSAIIEEAGIEGAGGQKSYWALAHPPGKPDFHNRDGFMAELPAAGRT
jgi:hypothetical protein